MDDRKERRIIKTGKEARDIIRKAVNFVGDIISSTLGPSGRNALLDRGRQDRSALNTNDGVSIAEELASDDACEHIVIKTLVEAAKQTNKDVGDGTTTSITIARQLVNDALDKIGDSDLDFVGNSVPVIELSRQIDAEKTKALELLQKKVTPIETLEKLKEVTFVSLEDKVIGDTVAEAVFAVGKDGFATVDNGFHGKVEVETTPGIKFYGKYAAPFMATNEKKQAIFENIPVLVTNFSFQTVGILTGLFASMNKEAPSQHNAIAVLGSKFEADAIKQVFNIYAQTVKQAKTTFRILLVKIPSLTEEELENVAAYVDGTFFNADTKTGMTPEKAKFNDLGFCKKLIVSEDESVIIGGRGLEKEVEIKQDEKGSYFTNKVEERLRKLKEKNETEDDEMFRKKRTDWIGKLSGGVSVIRVGAKTEVEAPYLKLKVEDAINSAKAALQGGVIRGGGVALKEVAEELGEESILCEALKAPYYQIQKNAGGSLEIDDWVIDPFKVTVSALENACSVARILITNNTIVAIPRDNPFEKLGEMIQ